jgi:hypothetical protein
MEEYYQSVPVSSQIVGQTSPLPTLRHKGAFAYEYGRRPPGVPPDTRSACRHAAGTRGLGMMPEVLLPCVYSLLARSVDVASRAAWPRLGHLRRRAVRAPWGLQRVTHAEA